MPTGKDFTPGNRGSTGKKNANCSFCRKSYREVGPLVEGPVGTYATFKGKTAEQWTADKTGL